MHMPSLPSACRCELSAALRISTLCSVLGIAVFERLLQALPHWARPWSPGRYEAYAAANLEAQDRVF